MYHQTERSLDLQKRVSDFMDAHIFPNEQRYEEEIRANEKAGNAYTTVKLMEELKAKARAEGLWNLFLPEAEHGPGLSNMEYAPLAELMGRVPGMWASEVFNCGAPDTGNMDMLARYGTKEQQERWLTPLLNGEIRSAFAMTEPLVASSDASNVETRIERDGDEYVINGSKTFITNGQHCDMVIVAARTNMNVRGAKGTTLFIVDADASGFSRGRNLEKIGLHASDTSELFFNEVRVPKSAVLGEVDAGFMILMQELRRERLAIASAAVAGAEGILDTTISYVSEREAFGASLAQLQNTRFGLARAATDIRINRSFIEECKAHLLEGTLDVATVSMAKVSATELQNRIADVCLQMHGGYGYMREYAVSRAYVDSRIQRIYGGANEIMLELIARDLLD